MKRILLAVTLAAAAATAFAADEDNNQYRNEAGKPDLHQPEVGAIASPYMVANADRYVLNARESTKINVVKTQIG